MRCQANRQVDNLSFVIWTSRVEGSGCRRFLSAVCGEYARKFVGGATFALVTASSPVDCKSCRCRLNTDPLAPSEF